MAGPAIRAMHLSAALAAEHHEVRLASTGRVDLTDDRFSIEAVDDAGLRELAAWCEIFVFQGWILVGRPDLLRDDLIVVADIYDPMHLEQLEQSAIRHDTARRHSVRNTVGVLNDQMGRADFMMCASRETALVLARSARRARPDQPEDLRRGRVALPRFSMLFLRRQRQPAGSERARPTRRPPRRRRGRPRRALGRRCLQLVRSADAH